jgi:hypothetical protein
LTWGALRQRGRRNSEKFVQQSIAKVQTLGGTFSLVEYRKEQRLLASLLAQRAPAAVDFIKHATSDQATPDHKAHMTWQSYVLQEAEAIARYHKIDWCLQEGREVLSLQHDGIIASRQEGERGETAAKRMTAHVRTEVRYPLIIKYEPMEQVTEEDEDDEWNMPPLSGPVT